MSFFHVYHNNCAPRFFKDFKDAEAYADKIMEEATHGYDGTIFIKENSILKIMCHELMRRNDPNAVVVYDNMYNQDRIKESNNIFNNKNGIS